MSNELAQFDSLKADIALFVSPTKLLKVTDFKSSAVAIEAGKKLKAMDKQIEDTRKLLVKPLNDRLDLINDYAKGIKSPVKEAIAILENEVTNFAREQDRLRQEEIRRAEEDRRNQERKAEEERRRINAEFEARQAAERAQIEAANAELASEYGSDDDTAAVQAQIDEAATQSERERIEATARLDREQAIRDAQHKETVWDIKQKQVKNARKNWKVEIIDISLVPKEFLIVTVNEAAATAAARGGVTDIPGLRLYQDLKVSFGQNTRVSSKALEHA